MKIGSLVKYVGGQDYNGDRLKPLYENKIYTVSCICTGNFHILGWKPALYLQEEGTVYAFRADMFVELHILSETLTKETQNEKE
jgi:hypothetical protein